MVTTQYQNSIQYSPFHLGVSFTLWEAQPLKHFVQLFAIENISFRDPKQFSAILDVLLLNVKTGVVGSNLFNIRMKPFRASKY